MGAIKTTKELKNERIIENRIAHDFFDAWVSNREQLWNKTFNYISW